ncbi:methyltransferase domain-containing protein [Embleya sp. MST-111070]|uniref:methyltransferase domain-containing protein n=1 Tax=Embleya sp. MST-111070 TaxID=3398231 RepID=UPI003F733649
MFECVAREDFVPDRIWPEDGEIVVDRRRDPDAWRVAVYSDRALVTQWDDGPHAGDGAGRLAMSSASAPSTVAEMLFDLDAAPGMRVLEIGTGTGYSAALLAARGCDVVSVEIDPELAEQARANLARAGYGDAVRVLAGDGTLGHPDAGPYDRVQVTAGVRRIPAAWIEQAKPGAVIVMPWGTDYTTGDCALRLVVDDDGRAACGPFTMATAFMKLRRQRPDRRHYGTTTLPDDWAEAAAASTTSLGWDDVVAGPFDPVGFVLGLHVPDCLAQPVPDGHAGGTLWLHGSDTGSGHSVAAIGFAAGYTPRVLQSGPRRLWDEVEAAWRWWVGQGRPTVHDFGLTATITPAADTSTVEQLAWYRDRNHPLAPAVHNVRPHGTAR